MSEAVKHILVHTELGPNMTVADMQRVLDDARTQEAPKDANIVVKRLIGSHLTKEMTIIDINWTVKL